MPTPSLVEYDLSKRLTGHLLCTYLLNPFTAVYLGYSERYQNLDIYTSRPLSLRVTGSPSTRASRQLFLKISYRLGL